jgi:hypothetical protein
MLAKGFDLLAALGKIYQMLGLGRFEGIIFVILNDDANCISPRPNLQNLNKKAGETSSRW